MYIRELDCIDVNMTVRGQDCMRRRVCTYISACVDVYVSTRICSHSAIKPARICVT
jgi:hypothetical protein